MGDIRSGSDKLLVETRGNTVVVTINTPPANTWDADNLGALKQLVQDCNAEKSVYALVVTGSGEKFFSAGADLNLFADGDKGVARSMAENFGGAFEALSEFRGVSIAAINGYAMGGGLAYRVAGFVGFVSAAAILFYGAWFRRKLKDVSYL